MVDRCVGKDSSHCDPSRITKDCRSRVMRLGTQWEESILMQLSTILFSFYAMVLLNLCIQIKDWWKQDFNFCILCVTMWTTLCPNQWVWLLPVGLDLASGSGICQWVWISSGSGYENPMGQTPCCIMWSAHNHGIMSCTTLCLFEVEYVINLPIQPMCKASYLQAENKRY